MVIAHLFGVYDPFSSAQRRGQEFIYKGSVDRNSGDSFQNRRKGRDLIGGQIASIGSGVGQELMSLV